MSRKACFLIFVISLVTILAAYIFKFSIVTKEVGTTFAEMQNIYIALASVITAVLLAKSKHYWLIMIGMAVIISIVTHVVIAGGTLMTIALLYKILASLVYIYLVQLVRYMI